MHFSKRSVGSDHQVSYWYCFSWGGGKGGDLIKELFEMLNKTWEASDYY